MRDSTGRICEGLALWSNMRWQTDRTRHNGFCLHRCCFLSTIQYLLLAWGSLSTPQRLHYRSKTVTGIIFHHSSGADPRSARPGSSQLNFWLVPMSGTILHSTPRDIIAPVSLLYHIGWENPSYPLHCLRPSNLEAFYNLLWKEAKIKSIGLRIFLSNVTIIGIGFFLFISFCYPVLLKSMSRCHSITGTEATLIS